MLKNVSDKNRIYPVYKQGTYNFLKDRMVRNQAGLGGMPLGTERRWFVMRDLKRANAKLPAYKLLGSEQFELFTPMKPRVTVQRGKRVCEEVPFLPDLLFVHSTFDRLSPVVEEVPTLQFRFVRGGGYREPMTVPDAEMERFIHAVRSSESLRYYRPGELTPSMFGRQVRIVGGLLDGYEGRLLKGSRAKYLLVELPGFLSAGVKVNPDFIQLV